MTKTITLTINLLEPTLVTSLDGDPNSAVSFQYLPGSVLRGIVIGNYMRHHKLKELDAADPETQCLFFNGSVRYLNAYPVDRLSQRALPTPISWYQDKAKQLLEKPEAGVYDLALEKPEDEDVELKKASKPFVTQGDNQTIRWVAPESQLTVHTSRDRKKGRSTKQSGDIFQYEALSAGQTFEAAILCENKQDAEIIQKYLPTRLTMGGSRNAGYGRVQINPNKPKDNWSEIALNDEAVEDKLIITLASDVLLRNEYGQYVADPELLTQAIGQRLGCSLDLQQAFVTTKPIGGFNRKWGLPLPQVTAVAMGSVLVFARPEHCPPEKLKDLLWQGIGERRIDGFGRVVVDWQREDTLKVEPRLPYEPQKPKIEEATAHTLAQQMVNRQFHQQLENKLVAYVNEKVTKALPIKNSQLSRLRSIVQNALLQPITDGRKRLTEYLDNLDKRQVTRNQFSRAQFDNESLLKWLANRVNDSARTIEGKLKLDKMPKIGNVEAQWTEDLRYEYNLRLIDAVLAQALKLAGKEERK